MGEFCHTLLPWTHACVHCPCTLKVYSSCCHDSWHPDRVREWMQWLLTACRFWAVSHYAWIEFVAYSLPIIHWHFTDHCVWLVKIIIKLFAKNRRWSRSKFNNDNHNITSLHGSVRAAGRILPSSLGVQYLDVYHWSALLVDGMACVCACVMLNYCLECRLCRLANGRLCTCTMISQSRQIEIT